LLTHKQIRNFTLGTGLAIAFAAFPVHAQSPAPVLVQAPPQGQPQQASQLLQERTPTPFPTPRKQATTPPRAPVARTSEERSGSFAARDGQHLHLETDIGSIHVFTNATDVVRYVVKIEADGVGPAANEFTRQFSLHAQTISGGVTISGSVPRRDLRERLRVTYEVHIPRHFILEVTTLAGNIQLDDLDGRATLTTNAGNITAGAIAGNARLESSGGGHILVGDVAGDLHIVTAGGHITVGNVTGNAVLKTGGGHIHAGVIGETAQVETGGGNVWIERATGRVTASSGGGQINFGEATGPIQARAAGGGVRVLRVSGPMQLDSNGGSIFLPRVDSPVRASTGTGKITAWLTPALMKTSGDSQLESRQGDIIVYVPRQLSVTIEATIDASLDHLITADPSLPLVVSYTNGESGRQMHGECAINGGGDVVYLRTTGGNIQLRYADDARLRQQVLVQQQIKQQLDAQQQLTLKMVEQSMEEVQRQTQTVVLQAMQHSSPGNFPPVSTPTQPPRAQPPAPPPPPPESEVLWLKLGEFWWGGVRVDPAEQQRRLQAQVRPIYPEVARTAGIEGTVSMRVLIGKDGSVEQISVVSGEPVLRNPAMDAVRRWRYQPLLLNGEPVSVVTVVNLEFRLH
jgi:TonB family protein